MNYPSIWSWIYVRIIDLGPGSDLEAGPTFIVKQEAIDKVFRRNGYFKLVLRLQKYLSIMYFTSFRYDIKSIL